MKTDEFDDVSKILSSPTEEVIDICICQSETLDVRVNIKDRQTLYEVWFINARNVTFSYRAFPQTLYLNDLRNDQLEQINYRLEQDDYDGLELYCDALALNQREIK